MFILEVITELEVPGLGMQALDPGAEIVEQFLSLEQVVPPYFLAVVLRAVLRENSVPNRLPELAFEHQLKATDH